MNENGQLPERFTISGELLQAALNCIVSANHPNTPYMQVNALVQELSQCEPVAMPEPEVENAPGS